MPKYTRRAVLDSVDPFQGYDTMEALMRIKQGEEALLEQMYKVGSGRTAGQLLAGEGR